MKDITGQTFGRLTVLRPSHKDARGEWYWLCKCECGNQITASGYKIRSGNTKSCGCLQNELRKSGVLRRTHGMTNNRIYYEWCNMKSRCNNHKNTMYKNYGGRGIRVCEEWVDSFEAFMHWAMSNGYNDAMTIERIDVDGDYTPKNCKWISAREQYLNRTDSHLLTAFGKTQTIKEWSEESGIKYDTIERRINQYGWSAEDAVTRKPNTKHP